MLTRLVAATTRIQRLVDELEELLLEVDPNLAAAGGAIDPTDPTFQRPSTLARAHNLYLVVNADFTTNTPPFTLTGLPRQ